MMRALILAYDFPPYVSVGGLRPYSWFKNFKEFGVVPVVVTRQWSNDLQNELDYIAPSKTQDSIIEENEFGTIIRTAYKPNLSNRLLLKHGEGKFRVIRKSITAYYEFMQYVNGSGPKKEIKIAAEKYLESNNVDIIIATAEPFVLFKYASELSQKYNIPWIADYRDPWSQDKSRSKLGPLRLFDRFFEKRIVKNALHITTVTPFFKKEIGSIADQKISIIPNGFDADIITATDGIPQNSEEFTISCAGTIHNWHPWKSFLEEIESYLKQEPTYSLRINFYGISNEREILEFISSRKKLRKAVYFFPKLPNKELLQELAKTNLLLLFNYYSYVGTKIYDYLALKRKVLFCYTNDQQALRLKDQFYNMPEDLEELRPQIEILANSKVGIFVENQSNLISVLEPLIEEHTQKGFVPCASSDLAKYSRKEQARVMCELIGSLINN